MHQSSPPVANRPERARNNQDYAARLRYGIEKLAGLKRCVRDAHFVNQTREILRVSGRLNIADPEPGILAWIERIQRPD
jgi:hypothetical protein